MPNFPQMIFRLTVVVCTTVALHAAPIANAESAHGGQRGSDDAPVQVSAHQPDHDLTVHAVGDDRLQIATGTIDIDDAATHDVRDDRMMGQTPGADDNLSTHDVGDDWR